MSISKPFSVDSLEARGNTIIQGNVISSDNRKVINFLRKRNKGLMIPLYIYPNFSGDDNENGTPNREDPEWFLNRVVNTLKKHNGLQHIVILNPGNGPGTVVDGNYTQAIRWLKGADVTVVGYVSTAYSPWFGTPEIETMETVKANVLKWQELYPEIDGIFYDEYPWDTESDTAKLALDYYVELTDFAHSRGFFPVIGNPGGQQQTNEYFVRNAADILMIYENDGQTLPPTKDLIEGLALFNRTNFESPSSRKASVVYNNPTLNKDHLEVMLSYSDYIYMTDDVFSPNPFDDFCTYFEELVEEVFKFGVMGGGGGASTSTGDEFPGSPSLGEEIWRTDLSSFFKWNGEVWIEIG